MYFPYHINKGEMGKEKRKKKISMRSLYTHLSYEDRVRYKGYEKDKDEKKEGAGEVRVEI